MSQTVRVTQLDGPLPNLALMRLSAWHRQRGDHVYYTRETGRGLFEPEYDRVYGSAIFQFSSDKVDRFRRNFPSAIIGGTYVGRETKDHPKIEDIIGNDNVVPDYSHWPSFTASLGYTQRGCRLKCGFCTVPTKEGKNRSTATLADIWRGPSHPKHIHLLDNDFFGQEAWEDRVREANDGGYRLCFSQGINVRLVTPHVAEMLASLPYYDNKFTKRRLYTAWDNIGDEKRFFDAIDMLEAAGIPPTRLMAYMLIGYDKRETWERIHYRFNRMVERGIDPYPMPFDQKNREHKRFQRWAVRRDYRNIPWDQYDASAKGALDKSNRQRSLFDTDEPGIGHNGGPDLWEDALPSPVHPQDG